MDLLEHNADRVSWDIADLPNCPLSYTVEVSYTLANPYEVIHDRLTYNLDRETAQQWAESRARIFPVLILAFPAIPYTLPYRPVVVAGFRPDQHAECGYTSFCLDGSPIISPPDCQ